VKLYAESSAVLAWLLDEPSAPEIRRALAEAEIVLASDLTVLECHRALIRAVSIGQLSEVEAADERSRLNQAAAHWTLLRLATDIVERARRPFPIEPIRTLDALHLASALVGRQAVPGIALLTLDHRVRGCARELGFQLIPA
jgi:predicted nucleic acid-binding protein